MRRQAREGVGRAWGEGVLLASPWSQTWAGEEGGVGEEEDAGAVGWRAWGGGREGRREESREKTRPRTGWRRRTTQDGKDEKRHAASWRDAQEEVGPASHRAHRNPGYRAHPQPDDTHAGRGRRGNENDRGTDHEKRKKKMTHDTPENGGNGKENEDGENGKERWWWGEEEKDQMLRNVVMRSPWSHLGLPTKS